MHILKIILISVTVLLMSACEVNVNLNLSVRSGTADDDYIAEPLPDSAQKYSQALEMSNEFLNAFKSKNYNHIYYSMVAEELRLEISEEEFIEALNVILGQAGEITQYKEMQWGFYSIKNDERNLIGSTKIVEHENIMVKYLFVFNEGEYHQIVGFQFKQRDGVKPPGEF